MYMRVCMYGCIIINTYMIFFQQLCFISFAKVVWKCVVYIHDIAFKPLKLKNKSCCVEKLCFMVLNVTFFNY